MAFLLSPIGLRIIGCIGILLALGGLYHHVWHNGYIAGSTSVQKDWDADKARREKALTDMTLLWNQQRQASEKAQREADDERAKRAQLASERAKALPAAIAAVPVPYQSVVVLNDAIRDSTVVASPAPKPAAAPAGPAAGSNVGLLTQWGVTCISMYDAARQRVNDWATFYQSLRNAQGNPEVTP